MNGRRHEPKFRRATPAVRREALIEATLNCLRKYGHDGVSVRRISAEAGVSIGLINHHFPSKAGLVAETYQTLAHSLTESIRARVEDTQASPRERLSLFFQESFAPKLVDPQLFGVWVVFWSMVAHTAEIRAVHDQTYGQYRKVLERLIDQLVRAGEAPPLKLRTAAISLSAILDGLWVELSLSPDTFKPAEAIAICEDWMDALCNGAFPRLQRRPGRAKLTKSRRGA